jgi:membrane protein DedA with SNARE-associated domain/rhodanese-related sulfurtransferase
MVWHFPTAIPPALCAWAVFMSVLITQLGAPVPAAPMLVLAGTMAAVGEVSYSSVFVAAVCATLLADTLWFTTGRLRGRRMLNSLVRFSLSFDATVRTARNIFERHGAPILAVSKFVPGLGLIAAPLLGTTSIDPRIFLLWDLLGASLWAGAWLIGGAALHDYIAQGMLLIRHNGGTIFDLFAVLAVLFVAYRWVRRIQFRRWLAKIRISPKQLDELMKSNAPPLIFDARPPEVRAKEAYRIPGARALDLQSPEQLDPELLARPIVVYCVCPNEATAKRIVAQLHAKNIHHVQALKGGLDAWERHGYPVEPLSADFHAPRDEEGDFDPVLDNEYTVRVRLTK